MGKRPARDRRNTTGGMGGAGGYRFQVRAIAYAAAHVLAGEPLQWIEAAGVDVPVETSAETGGPGDDFQVRLRGGTTVEVQCKSGLRQDSKFQSTLDQLVRGLLLDPALHAVLMMDSGASEALRKHLRDDLNRLRQGRKDRLHEPTRKMLRLLQAIPGFDMKALDRLHVELLEAPEKVALALLKRVVSTGREKDAWNALCNEALELTRSGGRRTEHSWRKFLASQRIPLTAVAAEAETVERQYRDWLIRDTRTLFIPGLGRELPITAAWLRLQAREVQTLAPATPETLEDQVETYRQWARGEGPDSKKTIDTELLTELGSRLVVSGGPGAGKSTLLRYVAHRKASAGRLVARVQLKLVALRLQRGDTFEQALSRVAGDGSGVPAHRCEELLANPELLLADGLDECGADASSMGEALKKWSHGHQGTTVIVTTRPVGYEAARFADWTHLELLPLQREDVSEYARQLFQLALPSGEDVEAALQRLEHALENHQAGSVAARNPLLLGFLASLVSQERLPGTRRVGLYQEIVSLAEQRIPREGSTEPFPELPVARHVLEQAAWALQETPVMGSDELKRRLGAELARRLQVDELRGEILAGQALEFWERQRLIERLRAGTAEVHVFVHASFGEFAAARHLLRLAPKSRGKLVASLRRSPQWYEVLMLAAGLQPEAIVPDLLALDVPDDVTSYEAILAAEALNESEAPSPGLIRQTLEKLGPRLTSSVPLLVFEAAEALRPLARRFPEIIGLLALEWSGSDNFSLRLSAHFLLLECGPPWAEPSRVRGMLREIAQLSEEEWERESWGGSRLSGQRARGRIELPHQFVDRSLVLLSEQPPQPEHDELIMQVYRQARGTLSVSLDLYYKLDRKRFEEVFLWAARSMAEVVVESAHPKQKAKPTPKEWELLEWILRITPESTLPPQATVAPSHAVALGRLFGGLDFLDGMLFPDMISFFERHGASEQKDLIGRAMMVALGIDPQQLRREAMALLACARGAASFNSQAMEALGVATALPRLPITPDWKKAAKLNLPADTLVHALSHPSWAVSTSAAQLLEHGAGGQEALKLLEQRVQTLRKREDEHLVLNVVGLAPLLWKEQQAAALLLPLLEPPVSFVNAPLYEVLPALYGRTRSEEIIGCLIRGVEAKDSRIACKAAEAVLEVAGVLPASAIEALARSAERWAWGEPECDQHPDVVVEGRVCSLCHRVLPHPKVPLLQLLLSKEGLTFENGLQLIQSPDAEVQAIAAAALVSRPTAEHLAQVIHKVVEHQLPPFVLENVLAVEAEALREVQGELRELLQLPWDTLRERMVEALATAGWVSRDEALSRAKAALKDPALGVRNQAVMTIRYIMAQ